MTELLGSVFVLGGAVFLFSAGLGVLRMPDCYNRIQTGTKASTLGTILVLVGLAIYHPGWTWKLVMLIYFVMITNPVSSHALSRAAHAIGIPAASSTVTDKLEAAEVDTETRGETAP